MSVEVDPGAGSLLSRLEAAFAAREAAALGAALEEAGQRARKAREAGAVSGWLGKAWDGLSGPTAWAKSPSRDEGLVPVEEASRWRWLEGVELLAPLSMPEHLRSALAEAAREGWTEGVAALIQAGAPMSPWEGLGAWSRARKMPSESTREARQSWPVSALSLACLGGWEDCAKLLLAAGADPSERDWLGTPLGCAARSGSAGCAKALLEAGANPGGLLPRLRKRSTDLGDWEWGVEQGAEIWSDAPLHWAASLGHSQVALALLEAGADVDAVNGQGEDALACALWMLPKMGQPGCLSLEAIGEIARRRKAPGKLASALLAKALASPWAARVGEAMAGRLERLEAVEEVKSEVLDGAKFLDEADFLDEAEVLEAFEKIEDLESFENWEEAEQSGNEDDAVERAPKKDEAESGEALGEMRRLEKLAEIEERRAKLAARSLAQKASAARALAAARSGAASSADAREALANRFQEMQSELRRLEAELQTLRSPQRRAWSD